MTTPGEKKIIDGILSRMSHDVVDRADHSDPAVVEVFDNVLSHKITPDEGVAMLRSLQAVNKPPAPPPPRIEYGRNDHHSKYIRAATDAILVRDKVLPRRQADRDVDEFMELSLPRMARNCMSMAGITPPLHDDKFGCITEALRTRVERGHSSSDFTSLVENIGNKAATLGWDNAPETWQYWTRQTETKDFREFSRITAPELPTPPEVKQMGGIESTSIGSDSAEKSAVKTYAEIVNYSREAMTNDDTERLTVTAEAAGRAAARLVGDLAYYALTANAVMADGNALFSAAHGNLIASGGAPSVSALDNIRALMSAQTGPSGEVLNIRGALLLCPTVLESTATTLRDAMNAQAEDDPLTPGYKAGRFAVVSDARLDSASATGFYMVADPRIFSTVDLVTIEGSRGRPVFEQFGRFNLDGISFRIRHDVVALPVDYRTMVSSKA